MVFVISQMEKGSAFANRVIVDIHVARVRFLYLYDTNNNIQKSTYKGRSICNENSRLYPKVLYLHNS